MHRDPVLGFEATEEVGAGPGPVKLHHQLQFDFLVVAVGARCNTFGAWAMGAWAMFRAVVCHPAHIVSYAVDAAGAWGLAGIPGVQQHAHFLKELADARGIRSSILRAIELASFPTTTPGQPA